MTTGQKRINIVIAICLQNDFIGPKGLVSDRIIQQAGLALHGGKNASARILGSADGPTPIDDMLEVVHGDDKTYVIYIEDHHVNNPNDPEIKSHFDIFGPHCVDGTEGAKAVGNLAVFQQQRRAQVISTNALGLITHQPVVDAIVSILRENEIDEPTQVKFLVLGGLTDVLVADCARGLNHICGVPNPWREEERWNFFLNVGVSSVYCFSNNSAHHDAALQGMGKVAISILKTDAEILRFLDIQA